MALDIMGACRKFYPRSEIPRMRLGFHALLTF